VRNPDWQEPGDHNWALPPTTPLSLLRDGWGTAAQAARDVSLFLGAMTTSRRYEGDGAPLNLALGSGTRVPAGWTGLDLSRKGPSVLTANLLLGIPIPDASASAVLAEHFLEHLFLDDIPRVLAECRRVMRSGAVLRVVSPDALVVARLLQRGAEAENDASVLADATMHRWPDDGLNWARTVNRISHQWGQHRSLLTADLVVEILGRLDFADVVALPADSTRNFRDGLPDVHPQRFPDEDQSQNFAVEAIRP
jgi:predicted SAM-dependent methyltransferase